jgi:hypothetical protein
MDAALKTWAAWAAGHDGQYHLGRTTAQVLAATDRIRRAAEQGRLRIGKYRLPAGDVGSWLGSLATRERFLPQSGPIMQALHDAARGRKVTNPVIEQWLAGFTSQEIVPGAAAFDATVCADRAVSRDPETYWQDIQAHRAEEPLFGPINRMISACAFWPSEPAEPSTAIDTNHPVLMAGATGDTTTPYAGQLAIHQALNGSRMITLPDTIAHGVYLFEGNPCLDTTVNRYLLDGILPEHDVTCPKSGAGADGSEVRPRRAGARVATAPRT